MSISHVFYGICTHAHIKRNYSLGQIHNDITLHFMDQWALLYFLVPYSFYKAISYTRSIISFF